jgi:SAM-dependent methyltransferase
MGMKAFVLDNPIVWKLSRLSLDGLFGLYRKRFRLLREWSVLDDAPSILDIGCGTGQYSVLTEGRYLGIDLNERYIRGARKRHPDGSKDFRCVDVRTLWEEKSRFDMVLLVDFLHHLADEHAIKILTMASQLAGKWVVNFEPLTHQTNPVGRWIVNHDQGHYMRPLDDLLDLYARAGVTITKSEELRLGPITTRALLCKV